MASANQGNPNLQQILDEKLVRGLPANLREEARNLNMPPSKDVKAFQEILQSSKNIIAVAGAGLSAASGTLPGKSEPPLLIVVWQEFPHSEVPVGYDEIWQFYHFRRESALRANPNDAHRALAAFSLSSIRHTIAPDSHFTLVTQNVDGLSPRANQEIAALHLTKDDDEPHLLEMHGRLFDILCPHKKCKHVEFNTSSPICSALSGTEGLVEQNDIDLQIDVKLLPRCSECGRLARPGVVWFGEMPHHLDTINELVDKADLCLVIGTSSTVNPAASYAEEVQNNGGVTAVFNLERTEGGEHADFLFLGPCEDTLPKVLGICISEKNGTLFIQPTRAS